MLFFRRRGKGRKTILIYLLLLLAILVVLPWASHLIFGGREEGIGMEGDNIRINVLLHETGEVVEMGLEEYVVGVVAAEMPASFPVEALKAQAVAARTYAVKRLQVADPRIKEIDLRADISSDPGINQAWISCQEMKKRWGPISYNKYLQKIKQAVQDTRQRVLLYDGQLIDPVYHASCGGRGTENSEDVWKYEIPYLRGVACGNHSEGNKEAEKVLALQEVDDLLGTKLQYLPAAKLNGEGGGVRITEKSPAGRVKVININGKQISGSEVRSKLGLLSTLFTWETEGNRIRITSVGHGHAVGMCQYGAAARAKEGKGYEEILKYYYTGVELAKIRQGS